ncbi:MAG TPA: glycosyltransferase family 4 protein [Natronoarchaeum rubrum]|nr:glycosyltransferase family 4 protein [Natronoarchaeum rubrum]
MNVLQLVTTESPFFTQQVRALEKNGVSCTTVSLPARGGERRSRSSYLRFYARILEESLGDYDVVHANYGLVGLLALAQPKRPVVLSLWGSEIMGHAEWLDEVSALAARRSDAVVAPSEAVSEHLECSHSVVPFGIDASRFQPTSRAAARDELGWDRDERVVLFPYDPDREVKNHPLAERVVERVPQDVTLKAVYDAPHEDVPTYMNASDAVLVTSRRESGPMVVKEAAMCNVPVVATDVGFVAESLDGVAHSRVCDAEDELVEGLASVLAADERSDGREQLEATSLEQMGERLVDVYEDVLERSADRATADRPSGRADA